MSPEPFAAIKNAIEHYRIDDIVISTFAGQKSAWLEGGLIDKVKDLTDRPVEHVEVDDDGSAGKVEQVERRRARDRTGAALMESASVAAGHGAHEHHGPPEANQSSKIDRQTLGILLFIVSEVMLFGAFFAAYFFIRVVAYDSGPWPPEPFELPIAVAGVNTAILISSSFTMHWALEAVRRDNHTALKAAWGSHGCSARRSSSSR